MYYATQDIDISGNEGKGCTDDHIALNAGTGTDDAEDMVRIDVVGNRIHGPATATNSMTNSGVGIEVRGAQNCTIAGNMIEDVFQAGIEISDFNAREFCGITITGNTLRGTSYTGTASAEPAIAPVRGQWRARGRHLRGHPRHRRRGEYRARLW